MITLKSHVLNEDKVGSNGCSTRAANWRCVYHIIGAEFERAGPSIRVFDATFCNILNPTIENFVSLEKIGTIRTESLPREASKQTLDVSHHRGR